MRAIIGVDVGSTTMSGGLVTAEGEILAVVQAATHRRGRGSAVDSLLEIVTGLVSDASARGIELLGVGIGIPGLIDAEKGMMCSSDNYVPEFYLVPLADRVAARTGLPVFVDNDVNTLALAEWTFGLERGVSSLVLLAVGTGIGGGVILNSALVRGHAGYAGELGHMTVNFRGPLCFCGTRGCLDAYVGGAQIAGHARASTHPGSMLMVRAGHDPGAITSAMVFEAAAAGDPQAAKIVDEACEALAASLGGLVNAFNPEVLVVTGGVANGFAPLEADLVSRIAAYALKPALARTRIAVVPSDKRRTVRGGAALVLYELSRRERSAALMSGPHASPGS
jgi:glucokinase